MNIIKSITGAIHSCLPKTQREVAALGMAGVSAYFGGVPCLATHLAVYALSKIPSSPSKEPEAAKPQETLPYKFQKLKKLFLVGLGARMAYALLDEGIGRSLGLETLRHGDRFSATFPLLFLASPILPQKWPDPVLAKGSLSLQILIELKGYALPPRKVTTTCLKIEECLVIFFQKYPP